MTDVSLVINLHREGRLAWRSIRSAYAAAEYARARGIEVEIVAIVDEPDRDAFSPTITLAHEAMEAKLVDEVWRVKRGDLGLARNFGVERSSGKYVTFLDGDDLTSETWIANAYLAAEKAIRNGESAVFHRQFVIQFGCGDNLVWEQPDSDDVHPDWLITESFWCSQPFALREVFESIPYRAVSPGFCFEDWVWNCDVLAAGIHHRIVDGEPIFVRRKPVLESMGQKGYAEHALAPATKLFSEPVSGFKRQFPKQKLEPVTEFPELMLEQWWKIHEIEPECYPREIDVWEKNCTNLDGGYDRVLAAYGHPDVVIACNWVKAGGADEAMLFHLRVHREAGKKVTLLVTAGDNASPWLSKAKALGADICDLYALTEDLDPKLRSSILTRVLVQRPPPVLSVHNSDLVWRLLVDNPKAFTAHSRVYLTAYCPDIAPDGHLTSGGFAALDKLHDYIAGVFFDGHAFRDELLKIYNYDPKKLIVLNHPCERKVRRRDRGPDRMLVPASAKIKGGHSDGQGGVIVYHEPGTQVQFAPPRLRVLWASRVDRQKRPELAFQIMALCAKEGLPIDFEVWGTGYHDGLEPRQFDLLTNTKYCGPFSGFDSLPLERYDAYLYTSAWDGMPNSVLAAMGAGLAVLSSDVGCLHELTGPGLVADDRPESFVRALASLIDGDVLAYGQRKAIEGVKDRTWESFSEQLCIVHGYERAGVLVRTKTEEQASA